MSTDVIEAWTGPVDYQLRVNGAPLDLSGMTVELILRRADRSIVSSTGDVSILSATDGTVRYLPDANDFVARRGPYLARFKVTDALSRVVFFPNAEAEVITVRSA
jgi:hypothetical protein